MSNALVPVPTRGKVWPNNTVPYTLAQGFSKTDLSLIQSAIDEIENKTCVRWVPRNGEKSYTTDTFGYAYEYGSVMHYGLADFQTSDNKTMDVLRVVPFGIEVGQRNGMTELNTLKVKAQFKYDQLPILSTTPTTQVTTKGSKNKLSHAQCRIIHDKYSYKGIGSRNLLGGKVWPNNTVPYTLAQGFSKTDLSLIQSAIDEIENKTCVRWVPRNGEKSYVYIKNDERGCFAILGYNQYRRKHKLNLQRSNGFFLLLACYVKIHWDRIKRHSLNNYFKNIYDNATVIPPKCQPSSNATTFDDCYSGYTTDTFGYAYDYGSVMHYGLDDFQTSDNNTMDVLRFVPLGIEVGQRNGMTELDALKIKAKYKCDQQSTLSTSLPTQVTTKGSKNNCEDKWTYCDLLKKYCSFEYTGENCPKTCKKCPEF
ncbi:unnamed protein product [Lepeophtheirus salmonis]|uniref:Metalloendopeptidase n=1 Tax=Lepeophtheirus salmonis TaxID=72036 RepID=A0A7R8H0N9_LEPSM|nr:unnamed protein product [Lepeophtheirus salmonis]CAF2794754.1 unnamed protein product [Lepeophtheirus salmonis]